MSDVKPEVQIARDLTAIVSMYHRLRFEAVYKFADKENPGGDPLLMSLPAANLREWEEIFDEAEATEYRTEGERKKAVAYVQDQTAELHPLLVLATWEDALRDELGVPTRERATVGKSTGYLRSAIPWIFDTNDDGDVNFSAVDQLMDDLARCKSMLENLLKDGERFERTETPCDAVDCSKPNLVKIYGDDDEPDFFKCPKCKKRFEHDEYVKTRKLHMFSESADRAWIDISAAAKSIERSQFTIRQWMKVADRGPHPRKPRVRYRDGGPLRLIEVFWPDVRDQDAIAKRRQILKRLAS